MVCKKKKQTKINQIVHKKKTKSKNNKKIENENQLFDVDFQCCF